MASMPRPRQAQTDRKSGRSTVASQAVAIMGLRQHWICAKLGGKTPQNGMTIAILANSMAI
jgi:hypothetical protein